MSATPLHVMIIGGGIGGLCLAQGLKKAGVNVAVYERDRTSTDRLQGYRIHIDPKGSRALHDCLPPHLYDAFVSTCGRSGRGFSFLDQNMKELIFIEIGNAEAKPDPVESHKAVGRITLRQILLAGLEDVVRFDKKYIRYEEGPDGKITAFFEDGASATGDVLVAADGGSSRVRKQFLPYAKRIDTGVLGIAGKVPLTDEIKPLLPPKLFEGPASILAPKGRGMFVAIQKFDREPCGVAGAIGGKDSAELHFGPLSGDTEDYVMWAFSARQEKYGFEEDPEEMDGSALRDVVLGMIEDWHPQLWSLVCAADPSTITFLPIRTSVPIDHWRTKNITLIGDAIHSMTPYRGIGANVALRDASLLRRNLVAAHHGEKPLLEAVHDYEVEMVGYGFDAVRSSMRALEQATSESAVALRLTKAVFRLLDAVPPLKSLAFRNLGNS